MSESGSELDDYTYASFLLATRCIGPFLDAKMTPSEESEPSSIFSQSTQPDGCQLPTTSTPDLSFATSSSPSWSPARESPSSRVTSSDCPQYGNVAPVFKPTSDHASFARHSNYVLRQAADQQSYSRTSEIQIPRIQPDSAEGISGLRFQLVSTAHDASTESAPTEYCSRSSASPRQELQRPSSLVGGTSGGDPIAPVSKSAGNSSRPKKRKAGATHDECFETRAMALIKDRGPSDPHFSAHGGAASVPSCGLNVFYPPSKKRKCDALSNPLLPVISACADSRALSNKNLLHPVPTVKCSSFDATHDAIKDGQVSEVAEPSHSHSPCAAGSVSPYPRTEPATPPVLGCSHGPSPDIPILEPRDFPESDIPRIFSTSGDAARARLVSLLRKEALSRGMERERALPASDLVSDNTLVTEVILWILTVEPPRGSQTASSIRGRKYSYDLHEQLTVHHDSRFLAALMLSLSFFPAKGDLNAVEQLEKGPCDEPKEGKIWDYAVAAIALAVKMHRDVYPPLKPIFACHFLAVASHKMGLEDLELAQRNLFEHFSYDLSMPTPQEYLDELRAALPTLRDALGSEHAWKEVLSETWKQLFAAVPWPDMLRFPVSLLTATALIEGITRVIHRRLSVIKTATRAEHLRRIEDWQVNHDDAAPGAGVPSPGITPVREPADAELDRLRATSTVFEDIREILGLSERKIEECEEWLALVRTDSERPRCSKYFSGIST